MNIIESTVAAPAPIEQTLFGRMKGDVAELVTRAQIEADEDLDIGDFLAIESATEEQAAAIGIKPLYVCLITVNGVLIPAIGGSAEVAFRCAVTLRAVGASISLAQKEFLAIKSPATTQAH